MYTNIFVCFSAESRICSIAPSKSLKTKFCFQNLHIFSIFQSMCRPTASRSARHLLHLRWRAPGGAVLVHQGAHVAVRPDGGAVDPLPAPFLQPLEHLAELRADHQCSAEESLQVVPGHVVPRTDPGGHDQLSLLGVLFHANGLRLEDAHALYLRHVAEVLHPALDWVDLEGLHADTVGEMRRENKASLNNCVYLCDRGVRGVSTYLRGVLGSEIRIYVDQKASVTKVTLS